MAESTSYLVISWANLQLWGYYRSDAWGGKKICHSRYLLERYHVWIHQGIYHISENRVTFFKYCLLFKLLRKLFQLNWRGFLLTMQYPVKFSQLEYCLHNSMPSNWNRFLTSISLTSVIPYCLWLHYSICLKYQSMHTNWSCNISAFVMIFGCIKNSTFSYFTFIGHTLFSCHLSE